MSAIERYLARYAEPVARQLDGLDGVFVRCVTIPSCGEGRALLYALVTVPSCIDGAVLAVVVVNERTDASTEVKAANRVTFAACAEAYGPGVPLESAGALVHKTEFGAVLLIDRTATRAFGPRQGVGLARRIAADIAVALCHDGRLLSPWIHCTDADVRLPADYFDRTALLSTEGNEPLSGAIYPFVHVCDQGSRQRAVVAAYDTWLRYYVAGLRWAGSPYAFHCVGSTIAIRVDAYVSVRGVPRRMAGEDFHLLMKLRKVGQLACLDGAPIRLQGRVSGRVPFGTGAAVSALLDSGAVLQVHDPAVFVHLQAWLQVLGDVVDDPTVAVVDAVVRRCDDDPALRGDVLVEALARVGRLDRLQRALNQARSPMRRSHQAMVAFDGLRTLRLIHTLRDLAWPDIPLSQALHEAPFSVPLVARV